MKKVRCAIYTRKSSEEGLEQDFNSLDAQREACSAYILSQTSEGWSPLPEQYDDGGISGGSLERPALQRLLSDVAAGLIDIIVVYKVDRLTRSLLDFAKLVEVFDKAGTSFVSVTQSFNTTTSMGRLTLNMLLSFAQFEREVTAERIRDKIAASKAKGMWMGGTPPLGYRPNGRSLAIVEEHAEIVCDIYRRYLALGNVRLLAEEMALAGIRSPERISGKGRKFGGCEFSRGQLYAILKNPIYVGEVTHRGRTYSGQQPAIINRGTWTQVQDRLAENVQGERRARAASPSPLAGLIVDQAGEPLLPVHACKGKVRYRYYVSRALQHCPADQSKTGIRLPAREIELLVAEQVANFFEDPTSLAAGACVTITRERIHEVNDRCTAIVADLRKGSRGGLAELVSRVRVLEDQIEIVLSTSAVADVLGSAIDVGAVPTFAITAAARLTRTGRAMRLVQPSGSVAASNHADPTLVKLLLKGHRWWSVLLDGRLTVTTLAHEMGVTPAYLTRVVRLAFLAPVVVESILDGRQRASLNGATLTASNAIAAAWPHQAERFLPEASTNRPDSPTSGMPR